MNYDEYSKHLQEIGIVFDEKDMELKNIEKELESLLKEDLDEVIIKYIKWELELLMFCEIPNERRKQNQEYLYPKFVYTDGTKVPDIDLFETDRNDLYRHRFKQTTNINYKLRILNFLYQVCPKEEKYILANEICEILFERIVNSKDNVIDVDGLSRLIELGLKFSIQEVINNFDQIVQFIFTKVSSNEARLSILRASDLVSKSVLNNKKVVLSDSNVQDMIKCIEDVRETYLDSKDYNMFRRSSVNYIDWLKISKKDSEIRNVLIEIGNSYIREAEDIDNPNWVKAEIYGNAAKHFANIGEREKVYELKVKIKEALRTANENNEFTELSASQTIETKWLDSYSDAFIGEDIEETFSRFSHASDFIIKKIGAEERAKEEAENPLYKLVDISHIYGNRKIFSAETEEGTVKNILFRNYGIELEMTFSILVNYIWNKMINEGLTKDIVFERLTDNEYMDETQKKLLNIGIARLFENDYVSALHIMVPQFESYFRTLFEWGGFPTTSLKSDTTQHEQVFNEFLRQDFVKDTIDEDLLFMIKFVMVEQLGKNLRNNIAHGLASLGTFSKGNSLVVLYLFLMITCIKWNFQS